MNVTSLLTTRIAAALVLTIVSTVSTATEANPNPQPIVGEWTSDAINGCSERIAFSAEGEIKVNSKDEILVGTYRTEPVPESPKILKLTRTISSSNNAPDCGGRIGNEAGKTRSAYIVWESAAEMRLCFDTVGYRCFGRFKKK